MKWYAANILDGVAHVRIESDIGCWNETSGDLRRELEAAQAERIELTVDSRGGSSICGLNLHDLFQQFPTEATITGNCWSSAYFAACGARKITAWENAKILLHQPCAHCVATSAELRREADALDDITAFVAKALQARTKQPAAIVAQWLAKDTYFTAAEALAAGLIDEIIPAPRARRSEQMLSTESPQVTPTGPTEDERLVLDLLRACGPVEVRDPNKFKRELAVWATYNLKQL